MEAWDERGPEPLDEVGELVITEPMPSMPLFLWGDEPTASGCARATSRCTPGIWRHGDWIRITPRGGAVIYGRSDSTINRQGVRMGTSEIYRAAGAVRGGARRARRGHPRARGPGGELRMILFVVLRDGRDARRGADDARSSAASARTARPATSPTRSARSTQVPRTLSGKVLEVPVKRILMGAPPEQAASVDSLADPRSLDYFVELAKELGGEPASPPGPR